MSAATKQGLLPQAIATITYCHERVYATNHWSLAQVIATNVYCHKLLIATIRLLVALSYFHKSKLWRQVSVATREKCGNCPHGCCNRSFYCHNFFFVAIAYFHAFYCNACQRKSFCGNRYILPQIGTYCDNFFVAIDPNPCSACAIKVRPNLCYASYFSLKLVFAMMSLF